MSSEFVNNNTITKDSSETDGGPGPLTYEQWLMSRQIHGLNQVQNRKNATILTLLSRALFHPFNVLLIVLAITSGVVHELKTMSVMLVMVLLSSSLRFYQEWRSKLEAQTLMKFEAAQVLVIRQCSISKLNRDMYVPARDLAPGDWVQLAPGDVVPADCKIVDAKDFHVSQAALTGESLPVHKYKKVNNNQFAGLTKLNKNEEPVSPVTSPTKSISMELPLLPERRPSFETAGKEMNEAHLTLSLENPEMCFFGSAVISGCAVCRVVCIGSETVYGKIAKKIASQRETNSFQRGVQGLSISFFITSLTMAATVLTLQGLLTKQWYEAVIFALSVAVGFTPEMLPMVVNATLSRGARMMSSQFCIVKKLDSVINLGAMNILCSDKTGTLTTGMVHLQKYVDRDGEIRNIILRLAFLNANYQTIQDSPLDSAIIRAYNDVFVRKNTIPCTPPGRLLPIRRNSSHSHRLNSSSSLDFSIRFRLLDEVPFDFVRRRMSVVLQDPIQESKRGILICKGAVEEVLSVCSEALMSHAIAEDIEDVCTFLLNEGQTEPLTIDMLNNFHAIKERLIGDGFSILALGFRFIDVKESYTKDDETNLIFAGYLAFLDPPKSTAQMAIALLSKNDVQVKVLSGDCPLVCKKVLDKVGLKVEADQITTGEELLKIKDPELLKQTAIHCTIFAKLTPLQKADLVRILQGQGENVVGFLGDGINDAAALAEADIGMAVNSATDVAKESSDIIIMDSNLVVIWDAVNIGRTTFGNTIKYILITASSNFGNVFSILIASVWLPFQPIGSFHILIQNLLYDLSQMSIPWDIMDKDYNSTCHVWSTRNILRFMLFVGPWSCLFDILTFLFMYFYFDIKSVDNQHSVKVFQTTWFTVGLLTQAVIVHIIRTPKIPFFQSRATRPVELLTIIVTMIGLSLPLLPTVSDWIGMTQLPWEVYPFIAVILLSYCLVTQITKKLYIRIFGKWL